jgi:peptide/nickel transport system substrate-binding protein
MTEREMKLAQAAKLVGRGKVSRRDFIQQALAAGLTLPVANAMLVRIARAGPKRGGTFRIGISHGATTDTMDPGVYNAYTGPVLWGALSNSLTEIDAKGNAVPDLAESFEPAAGAKKWVFKLRRSATFHDGKLVTADDVVASYEYHRGEGSKSVAKSLLEPITGMKAEGSETVVFELSGGNVDFPYLASDSHLPIMPVKDGAVDWRSGNRTGPYVLGKFDPGVITTLTRNPNYFKSDRAWFDAVDALSIIDVTARTNALNNGEIHYMDRADLKTLDLLRQNPNLVIAETTGYGHYVYAMNVTKPPFDNLDVRLALKHSLNREEIVEKVFLNYGVVGNDNPIAPTVKFAIDPQPRHTYDPEKVKSHLKKAGMENVQIDLSVADAAFIGAAESALMWQEHARAAGLNLNVIREPNDGYWDNVWRKKPLVASFWGGRPTCDWMFTTGYAADAPWNETFWNNPHFNELLIAARSETEEAKRAAMYAEMQQLVHDDGGLITLVFNSYVDAHVSNLAHGEVAGNWPMDGEKIAERWWFESR